MGLFDTKAGRKIRAAIVRYLLEPWISTQKVECYVIFLGRLVFRLRKPYVIAITGTVGKSTTTAMVACVLSQPPARRIVGPVAHTLENMNDDLGLAATLLRFTEFVHSAGTYLRMFSLLAVASWRALRALVGPYPKVLVLECGVGSTASLDFQTRLAPPNVSVVTNIGPAHIELLKSIEGLLHEKGALVRAVPRDGLVVLGAEHAYVPQLEAMARAPVVKVGGEGFELSRNLTRAVCRHVGIPEQVIEDGLRAFKGTERRLMRMDFPDMTVIDDSWNANPMSMRLGLDTLVELAPPGRRRVALLGYMAELGDDGPRFHEEMGAYARGRADFVVGVGELSKHYQPDLWFDDCEECADRMETFLRPGDFILVKGSHSARMTWVADKLRQRAEKRGEQRRHATA